MYISKCYNKFIIFPDFELFQKKMIMIITKIIVEAKTMNATYENYTLLELISIMENTEYRRMCPWNKKAIIEFIEQNKMDIPKKIGKLEPTQWHHYSTTQGEGVLCTPMCKFYDGCAILLQDGTVYDIEMREAIADDDDIVICVDLMGDYEEQDKHMRGDEFVYILDYEDITLIQVRDLDYYVSEDQREYWKCRDLSGA